MTINSNCYAFKSFHQHINHEKEWSVINLKQLILIAFFFTKQKEVTIHLIECNINYAVSSLRDVTRRAMNKAVIEEKYFSNSSVVIMSWFFFITLSLQSITTTYTIYKKIFYDSFILYFFYTLAQVGKINKIKFPLLKI